MKKKFLGLMLSLMGLLTTVATGQDISLYPYSDQEVVDIGQQYCIEIKVDNFIDMIGFQFSVGWDTSAMRLDSAFALNLPNYDSNHIGVSPAVEEGFLTTIWVFVDSAITLPDSSNLFEVCFTVLPGADSINTIQILDYPTQIEFVNFNEEILTVNPGSCSFSLPDQTMGLSMWPGDTDQSEAVDHYDLLNIGLGFGETGPPRVNASINWQEQEAEVWDYSTPNSTINGVHLDTDGNGIVNDSDVLAIEQNWGETTNFWNSGDENRGLALADPPLVVDTATVNPGQEATFDILFGDETTPAADIYGLAFSVVYDPGAVVPGSVDITFEDSWLGDESAELITVFRDHPEDNRIDIALSRIDHAPRDGQGAIAQLHLTIADIMPGAEGYPLPFQVENAKIIDNIETLITAVTPITYSEVMGTVGAQNPALLQQVQIFPIPTEDFLQIKTNGLNIETIDILSLDGKNVRHLEENLSTVNVSALKSGTYILQLQTSKGPIRKSFIKY